VTVQYETSCLIVINKVKPWWKSASRALASPSPALHDLHRFPGSSGLEAEEVDPGTDRPSPGVVSVPGEAVGSGRERPRWPSPVPGSTETDRAFCPADTRSSSPSGYASGIPLRLTCYARSCMVSETMKMFLWVGSSRDDLRRFPALPRRLAGYELFRVQGGREPADQKPMATIGAGAYEIRIRTGREHRVFYVAKFAEGIYVLHAFEKKGQKTPRRDVEIGRLRYQEMLHHRREEGRKS
jgi:phage-related protein